MKMKKIRVFKMVYADGDTMFDARDRDDGGIHMAFRSVESVGRYVKDGADHFLKEYKNSPFTAAVVIDFRPFHEIERKNAPNAPYRCLPLSEEEKEEFWKYFSAP